ncbi:MAG: SusC/RagA family TonB-linked outer membrane protein [Cytophagaceae bacterium SCN 52-12]|nr:MAG: SusC/RagA family TonB-linked outer membrane protein [Cytophagaceae bacterium SCN 52-12]
MKRITLPAAWRSRLRNALFPPCLIFLCITVSFAYTDSVIPQELLNKNIRVNIRQASLKQALAQIERSAGVRFAYSKDIIPVDQTVTIDVRSEKLSVILEKLLTPLNVSYKVADDQILLFLIEKKSAAVNPQPKSAALPPTDHRVRGKVTDAETREPLPGVNIQVKNTQTGTVTDETGSFTLHMAEGNQVLVFSYVGYVKQEIPVNNRTEINVSMAADMRNLETVIVTALGIKREAKKLGYATSTVNTEAIATNRTNNLGNNLQGKIAGVNVSATASGTAGTSKIRIRGQSSFKGDNSPLIVVNGIPVNNSSFGAKSGDTEGTTTRGGITSDGGDGLVSINPDDIESMTVLKGAAAAALYGFRAKDGAIVITTKSGTKNKGIGLEYNTNYTIDRAVDETDFQYEYGQGEGGIRPSTLAMAQSSSIWSFGEKLDGKPTIQFDGVERPYAAVRGRINKFYETGFTFTNTISMNAGNDKGGVYVSLSNLANKGISPRNTFDKKSINLGANYQLSRRLSLHSNVNYSYENIKNPPQIAVQNLNPNAALYTWANSVGYDVLREKRKDPVTGDETPTSRFTPRNNPYWSTYEHFENIIRDRIFGNFSMRYELTDWLFVQGRVGQDYFSRDNDYNLPTGSRHLNSVANGFNGQYYQENRRFRETNIDFLVGAHKAWGDFGFDLNLGGNKLDQESRNNNTLVNNFFIRDLYTVANGQIKDPQYYYSRKKVNSLYGSLELSWKDFLFLNITGRNDWFSTLNPRSNSYLYPSVSGSFVFSQALEMPAWLSFGKVRAAYAEVGGDTDPYANSLYYSLNANTHLGQALGSIASGVSPNQNLRPLKVKEAEVGLELRTFRSRLNLDIAYYRKNTIDEILDVAVSNTSGYTSTRVNVGSLRNEGVEMLLTVVPVQSGNWDWETGINLTYNESLVVSLAGEQKQIIVGTNSDFTGRVAHEVGKPMASLLGAGYQRDAQGRKIFAANGAPMYNRDLVSWGSAMPRWIGGWTNTVQFKGFRLSTLVDFKAGHRLISATNYNLWRHGLHKGTLEGREGGVKGAGVTADGSPNETYIEASAYYGTIRNITSFVEDFVYNAGFIKFRQLSLGYKLPSSLTARTPFQAVTLSFVGNNVLILKKHTPNIDPEQLGQASDNLAGIESGALPLTRSIGFNLNLKF